MTGTKGIAFEDGEPVRFHHCDPAGLIFYPQCFVLFHELMEDWFTRGLDEPYPDLVMRRRIEHERAHDCDHAEPDKDRRQHFRKVAGVHTTGRPHRVLGADHESAEASLRPD